MEAACVRRRHLQILKQLVRTIDPVPPPKPYDCFDMIGGGGTDGRIAIMFGRVRKSVNECIDAYVTLSDPVVEKKHHCVNINGEIQRQFDSEDLKQAMREIIRSPGLREDVLLKDAPEAKCKVFVCATSRETSATARLTYRSPRGRGSVPSRKIWEVSRATSSFFDPITLGIYGQGFVDGATGMNNPVCE
ncbi:hypothetical protein K469DRAFT_767988 [Zopfia rhizophila CBS 207.26]|uniref:PNPLA domain-containing protein n=1 Tax=Zopfia rhizophila CBS 207.26 TaxID=1314779 RepID=A0A6A6EEX4_9PEZI|nr:hypothetical protein K469DRAFT_767988 [Zopfia rhizophila CBS 207.26]